MKLQLLRYASDKNSTGGALFIDNKFVCHTCEDPYRETKIRDITRIPPGTYVIKLRPFGGMHERYNITYDFHRGMLHLQDVPEFKWIYIHPGNFPSDTSGCILIGYTSLAKGGFAVGRSKTAYKDIYSTIAHAINTGEEVTITITDYDQIIQKSV